jgi:putative FmdB family regulatory protein
MPTYDYKCAACGHRFEAFQSITADALAKCPECGKKRLERLIGAGAAVIFKGSGFYQTDYKQPAGGPKADDTKTDAAKSGTAKTDAKPDDGAAKAGGCTPACGTKDASAGCAINKKKE